MLMAMKVKHHAFGVPALEETSDLDYACYLLILAGDETWVCQSLDRGGKDLSLRSLQTEAGEWNHRHAGPDWL